jgi:hypothetical protein
MPAIENPLRDVFGMHVQEGFVLTCEGVLEAVFGCGGRSDSVR